MRNFLSAAIMAIAIAISNTSCLHQVPACGLEKFVRVVAIDDGDPSTSEWGYAKSGINAVSFIQSGLYTFEDQQFAVFYRRNPTSSSDVTNDTIAVARRNLLDNRWDVFKTTFRADNIDDPHDVAVFGIDRLGYMHLSWGMHARRMHYARTIAPVTGSNPVIFGPDEGTMTGSETQVTYPQFYSLPGGGLLFMYREGRSGDGDIYLSRYDIGKNKWFPVHVTNYGGPIPLILGSVWSPDWNAYPNMMAIDSQGNLHLTWTNRYGSDSPEAEKGYQSNHNIYYAWSPDEGRTWRRMDGSVYSLPISQGEADVRSSAEVVLDIPEGSSLMNQAGMAIGRKGYPVIATWWAPEAQNGNHRRQYMIVFYDGERWHTRQISNRVIDDPGIKMAEERVRDLGRPLVLIDEDDRIIVLYRDNQDLNGITVVYSRPAAEDPLRREWNSFDLSTGNLGIYEPVYDRSLWERMGLINLIYQPQSGFGNSFALSNHASPMAILEWNAREHFRCLELGRHGNGLLALGHENR